MNPGSKTLRRKSQRFSVNISVSISQAVSDAAGLSWHCVQHHHRVAVIHVDYAGLQAFILEQSALGLSVCLHTAVIIQVVTGKIGKQRDAERYTCHSILVQALR